MPDAKRRASTSASTDALIDNALVTTTLWLVTVIASMSLLRVFTTRELLVPVVVAASLTIMATFLARAATVPWIVGVLGSCALEAGLLAVWIHRTAGLPITTSTPRFALDVMRDAWSTIDQLKTPTAPQLGFALMVLIGTWAIATVADTLAFRLRSPLEALIPLVALLAVSSALTRHEHTVGRVRAAAAVVAAGLLHLLVVAIVDRRRTRTWFGDVRPKRAVAIGTSAALCAAVGGTLLLTIPQSGLATLEPTVNLHVGSTDNDPRVVASPLVSMRRQLLVLSDDEQFTVRSVGADGQPARSYWRQTALEDFDGTSWTGSGSFTQVPSRSTLPLGSDAILGASMRQQFRIGSLVSTWLPVAYRPTAVDAPDIPSDATLSFDPETASLITKRASVEGLTYGATSQLPPSSPDDALLPEGDGVTAGVPASLLALPPDFSDRVRDLAKQITANQTTVIGKARALQDYLRTFRYTTDVPAPSSKGDLERFLFDEQAGYCEQFSGAFAAMARAIGIPARVAVGFTPGRFDSTDGRFHITGRNAHAWPEVFLAGTGWIPFEPTPGRGIPGAELFTGVPDQDASEGLGPQTQTTAPTIAPTDATATSTVPGGAGVTTPAAEATVPATPPTTAARASRAAHKTRRTLLVVSFGVLLLAFVLVLGRTTVDAIGDARARAEGPAEAVERSWRRMLRAVRWLGMRPLPRETPEAFAHRSRQGAPETATLAPLVTKARFGAPGSVSEADAEAAADGLRRCEADVRATLPWGSRIARHVGLPPWPRMPRLRLPFRG